MLEGMVLGRSEGDDAVRITTVTESRAEEIAGRQRRYLISMIIRLVCFIAAYFVGPGWLRWVLMAGAVFLPYIAVVAANATDLRMDRFRLTAPPPAGELTASGDDALPPSQED